MTYSPMTDPWDCPVWGGDELLEYGNELVVVPRLCEYCFGHPAVYHCCELWPATYLCRICTDERVPLRQKARNSWTSRHYISSSPLSFSAL